MAKRAQQVPAETAELVAAYKLILQKVLDRRPSGTRQRISVTLGKNRSFVSQISNPSYPTPIPAIHIERIMEICHFSQAERQAFMDAYGKAHPRRPPPGDRKRRLRPHTIHLPDLGSEARNRKLDALVGDFLQQLTDILVEDNC